MNNGYHEFNEKTKQLVSLETTCYYCKSAASDDIFEHHYQPVFKENDRTNIIVYSSVKYSKIEIGIPRCTSCAEIHNKINSNAMTWSFVVTGVCIILGFVLFGLYGIFLLVFSPLLWFVVNYLIKEGLNENGGIPTPKAGAEQNPTVQEFIINGWSFTQPSA